VAGHSSLHRVDRHNKTVLCGLSARILRGSPHLWAVEDAWNDTSFGQIFSTREISAAFGQQMVRRRRGAAWYAPTI
jgi:hypothetical protein